LNIIEQDNIGINGASFPSSHAFISYALANKYSDKFPNKKNELYELANKLSRVRIIGGMHYPSDIEYGRYLADKYKKYLNYL
jgi:acid phosphatase (class A)